jgi:hypothetical protein
MRALHFQLSNQVTVSHKIRYKSYTTGGRNNVAHLVSLSRELIDSARSTRI